MATENATTPGIDSAVRSFLRDLEVGKSPATVHSYGTALRHFLRYLEHTLAAEPSVVPLASAVVGSLTVDHVLDYARWLMREQPELPRGTLFTYTTPVVRFYAFLLREGLREDLPLPRLTERLRALRGRRPRALPRVPGDGVIAALVEAARSRPPAAERRGELVRLRDIAILECLRASGLRVSELVGLRRGDLDRDAGTARVVGKGNKVRTAFFTARSLRALIAYLEVRADGDVARSLGAAPVFTRHDRGAGGKLAPLTTKSIRSIVERLAAAAGRADAGVTPHRIRAWFATHIVEETGDLAAAQDLLGHESADTTRIYTKVASRRLRQVHEQAFDQSDPRR